jgi:hypothetical protein
MNEKKINVSNVQKAYCQNENDNYKAIVTSAFFFYLLKCAKSHLLISINLPLLPNLLRFLARIRFS